MADTEPLIGRQAIREISLSDFMCLLFRLLKSELL